jgi:predicted nucleotidyltransferase
MKFGLKEDTMAAIADCMAKIPKIEKVIIYGSRAKGNYRKSSDIDLVLQGRELTINDVLMLENDLDELLLPYLFDISISHHIKQPDLLEHIDRVGKVFYEPDIDVDKK